MAAPSTFGVTAALVRRAYFPHLDEFSASSVPVALRVTEIIADAAADLEGKLSQEDLAASAITDSASAAYRWCANTLRLASAISALQEMASADPEVVKAWQARLNARYKDLADNGYLALGGGVSAPSQQADGPSHHIDEYGLDIDETSDLSDATNPFRKSDDL